MIAFWKGKLVTTLMEECSMSILEKMGGTWEIVDTFRKRKGYTDYIAVLKLDGAQNHIVVRRGENGRTYYLGCVYDMPGEDAADMEWYIFRHCHGRQGKLALDGCSSEYGEEVSPGLISCFGWVFLGLVVFHMFKFLFLGILINGMYAAGFLICYLFSGKMLSLVHSRIR